MKADVAHQGMEGADNPHRRQRLGRSTPRPQSQADRDEQKKKEGASPILQATPSRCL
jgi:hypothetical protein